MEHWDLRKQMNALLDLKSLMNWDDDNPEWLEKRNELVATDSKMKASMGGGATAAAVPAAPQVKTESGEERTGREHIAWKGLEGHHADLAEDFEDVKKQMGELFGGRFINDVASPNGVTANMQPTKRLLCREQNIRLRAIQVSKGVYFIEIDPRNTAGQQVTEQYETKKRGKKPGAKPKGSDKGEKKGKGKGGKGGKGEKGEKGGKPKPNEEEAAETGEEGAEKEKGGAEVDPNDDPGTEEETDTEGKKGDGEGGSEATEKIAHSPREDREKARDAAKRKREEEVEAEQAKEKPKEKGGSKKTKTDGKGGTSKNPVQPVKGGKAQGKNPEVKGAAPAASPSKGRGFTTEELQAVGGRKTRRGK